MNWRCIATVFLISCIPVCVVADDAQPKFEANNELILEKVFRYRQYKYDPPIERAISSLSGFRSYSSPEDALLSIFGAMGSGNYEGWLGSWTQTDQLELIT